MFVILRDKLYRGSHLSLFPERRVWHACPFISNKVRGPLVHSESKKYMWALKLGGAGRPNAQLTSLEM